MDENNNQKQGFPIELNAETALGEYANLALISHSSSDFVIDFARMLPGMPKPQVRSRVVLAPEHAKRLLQALQENIYTSALEVYGSQSICGMFFKSV